MKDINKKNESKKSIDFNRKKDVGNLGEEIACTFLVRNGFQILERNYLRKWGEIDIIAIKDNVLTFIEVKSVIDNSHISKKEFRPEENVHRQKQRRLRRTIQTYMAQAGYGRNGIFLFHVMVVRLNTLTRRAHITLLDNIIL